MKSAIATLEKTVCTLEVRVNNTLQSITATDISKTRVFLTRR